MMFVGLMFVAIAATVVFVFFFFKKYKHTEFLKE